MHESKPGTQKPLLHAINLVALTGLIPVVCLVFCRIVATMLYLCNFCAYH
jgi:hypothetical protein